MNRKLYLGIDIGGTKSSCAVGLSPAERLGARIIPTDTSIPAPAFLDILFDAAEAVLGDVRKPGDALADIGIVCGGPLDEKAGTVFAPPNLPGWDMVHILDEVERRFGVRGRLMNDANAGVLAEWTYGAGRGLQNLVFLTFGTGMGAGIMLGNTLLTGAFGNAGEVGRIPMTLRMPDMGLLEGTFEDFCSGGGIARLSKSFASGHGKEPSAFFDLEGELSAKSIFESARRGNRNAEDVVAFCGRALGRGLAMIIDILDPQAIILGSIFFRNEDMLRKPMEETLEALVLEHSSQNSRILPAGLGEAIGDVASLHLAVTP